MNPIKWLIEAGREIKYLVKNKPGPPKHHNVHLRGVGWTRASKEQSKTRRLMAKKSRRINRR